MKSKEPIIDEEFSRLHREQTPSEYMLLKEDIKECRGLREPVLVWEEENRVIDGHHRLRACKELKIKPSYRYMSFPNRESVIFYIKLHQAGRRNATAQEYGINLLSLRDSCLALEKSGVNLPRLSIKAIAEMCDLSEKTLKKLNIINREGSEELKEEVKTKEKSVDAGYKELPSVQEKERNKERKKRENNVFEPHTAPKPKPKPEATVPEPEPGPKNATPGPDEKILEKISAPENAPGKSEIPEGMQTCPKCKGSGYVKKVVHTVSDDCFQCGECGSKKYTNLEGLKKCPNCGAPVNGG